MHDSLVAIAQVIEFDSEFATVVAQRIDLLSRNWIRDRKVAVGSWDIVIRCGDRAFWAAHLAARQSQAFKGLRARDLMHQL